MLRPLAAAAALTALAPSQAIRDADVPWTLASRGAVFDPARGTVLCRGSAGMHELRGNQWHRLPIGAPMRPYGATLVAATGQRRWLAIGRGYSGSVVETWACDMLQWTQLSTSPVSYWSEHSVAYDRARDEVVLFGAFTGPPLTGTFASTWVFDGTDWQLRATPVAPPAAFKGAMAYDGARQRTVLVPGFNQGTCQTWEWDGVAWTQVVTPTTLPARYDAAMAYDEARARMVLVGGRNATGALSDCWEYDGVNWMLRPALPAAARHGHDLVHDPVQARTLCLGGRDDASFQCQDVWGWDGTAWTPGPGFGAAPRAINGAALAIEPGGASVLLYGGASFPLHWTLPLSYLTETWRWNGTAWSQLAGSAPELWPGGPPAEMLGGLMWSQAGQLYLLHGSSPYPAPLPPGSGMSMWNGTAWTSFSPALPLRPGTAIAVDTQANEALLFGGRGATWSAPLGDTWTFDGTTWQQRSPAASPPPRSDFALAYDAARDRTVLFGGLGASASPLSDTWEWNGTVWQQVVTANQPPQGAATWDPVAQRVVLFTRDEVGPPLPGSVARMWSYDGVDWTPNPIDTTSGWSGAPLGAFGNDLLVTHTSRLQRFHRTASQLAAIGTGCTNDAPLLAANAWPDLGAATFTVELTYAPPQSVVLLAGSVTQVNVPLLGCTLRVDPTQLVLALPTDARGRADAPLPVPATTTLLGAELFFQGAALSPLAPAGITLTRGLRMRIGR